MILYLLVADHSNSCLVYITDVQLLVVMDQDTSQDCLLLTEGADFLLNALVYKLRKRFRSDQQYFW